MKLGAAMTQRWFILACFVPLACEVPQRPRGDSAPGQPAETVSSQKAFVVFAAAEFVIDRIGIPIGPPVTVGSLPSPTTMWSEAPEVVAVEPSGELRGLRNGTTTVRAIGTGSAIRVTVAEAESIEVIPGRLELETGKEAVLTIRGRDHAEVPRHAVKWASTAPLTAQVHAGRVRAGEVPGRALLIASYGGHTSTVEAEVFVPAVPSFSVIPERPELHVGQLVYFQAVSRAGPIDARWTSSNGRIAARLSGPTFRAAGTGRALVCARAGSRRACSNVEVIP